MINKTRKWFHFVLPENCQTREATNSPRYVCRIYGNKPSFSHKMDQRSLIAFPHNLYTVTEIYVFLCKVFFTGPFDKNAKIIYAQTLIYENRNVDVNYGRSATTGRFTKAPRGCLHTLTTAHCFRVMHFNRIRLVWNDWLVEHQRCIDSLRAVAWREELLSPPALLFREHARVQRARLACSSASVVCLPAYFALGIQKASASDPHIPTVIAAVCVQDGRLSVRAPAPEPVSQ